MKKLFKIPLLIVAGAAALFAVTFGIYFFNLDMKFMALIEPLLLKHYDTMPRKQYL